MLSVYTLDSRNLLYSFGADSMPCGDDIVDDVNDNSPKCVFGTSKIAPHHDPPHSHRPAGRTESPSTTTSTSKTESITSTAKKANTLADIGYVFHKQVAEGFHSRVYLATYTEQRASEMSDHHHVDHAVPLKKRKLAVKVLDAGKVLHDFTKKFFLREIDILRKVRHPHIIHVRSIWKIDRKYCIFMRLAENGDLCDFIRNHGTPKEPVMKKWTRDLIVALMYLHQIDIAHRDIKCENILITAKNNIKLADFGFARYTKDHQGRPQFAATDCGSLNYTAPEVLLGVPYNPKIADIWSLGVVVYILLCGRFPFLSTDVTNLYREQVNKAYDIPQRAANHASRSLLEVIMQLLEPVYHERITLDDLLHSRWIGVPLGHDGLTGPERNALIIRNEDVHYSGS